jgi:hypothetical protein
MQSVNATSILLPFNLHLNVPLNPPEKASLQKAFLRKSVFPKFQKVGLQEILNLGKLLSSVIYYFVVYYVKEKFIFPIFVCPIVNFQGKNAFRRNKIL